MIKENINLANVLMGEQMVSWGVNLNGPRFKGIIHTVCMLVVSAHELKSSLDLLQI